MLPAGESLDGSFAKVSNGESYGTVAVISADDLPLESSQRILVTHLTDSLNAGMRFRNEDRRLLEERGGHPHLVRRGEATLSLSLADVPGWRAWAVDASGRRLRGVPLVREGASWILTAQTVTPEGTQLAYELALE